MSRKLTITAIRVRATDDITGGDRIYILAGEARIDLPGTFEKSDEWIHFNESLSNLAELAPDVGVFSVYESDITGDDLIGQISLPPDGYGEFTETVSNGVAIYEIAFAIVSL